MNGERERVEKGMQGMKRKATTNLHNEMFGHGRSVVVLRALRIKKRGKSLFEGQNFGATRRG
jgi:hypothetical protein